VAAGGGDRPAAYAQAQAFFSSWLGRSPAYRLDLCAVLFISAMASAISSGTPAMVFDIATTYATGWAVVATSAGLTLIAVIAGIVQWQHG